MVRNEEVSPINVEYSEVSPRRDERIIDNPFMRTDNNAFGQMASLVNKSDRQSGLRPPETDQFFGTFVSNIEDKMDDDDQESNQVVLPFEVLIEQHHLATFLKAWDTFGYRVKYTEFVRIL